MLIFIDNIRKKKKQKQKLHHWSASRLCLFIFGKAHGSVDRLIRVLKSLQWKQNIQLQTQLCKLIVKCTLSHTRKKSSNRLTTVESRSLSSTTNKQKKKNKNCYCCSFCCYIFFVCCIFILFIFIISHLTMKNWVTITKSRRIATIFTPNAASKVRLARIEYLFAS